MTAQPVPGAIASIGTERQYVTSQIWEKVFQSELSRVKLCDHIAQVAIKAMADYWEQYMLTPRCACDTSRGLAHRADCDLKQAQG